jgi:threonine/homoserine/homoserine lactone efflux protein
LAFLGGLFIVSSLIVFAAVAWFAGYIGEWPQRSDGVQVVMNRIAGMEFVVLALRLAVSERQ